MKKEIIDIPEVNLSDVKEFWVLGSQYKDGILGEYNLKIDVKAAITNNGSGNVSPDGNIYKYIDLGLPSGLLWAATDLGTSQLYANGISYYWGGTTPAGSEPPYYDEQNSYTKYNSTDGKTELETSDDAAYVNMGSDWRMPTSDEGNDLFDSCYVLSEYTTPQMPNENGIWLIGPNGHCYPFGEIILNPDAGYMCLDRDSYYYDTILLVSPTSGIAMRDISGKVRGVTESSEGKEEVVLTFKDVTGQDFLFYYPETGTLLHSFPEFLEFDANKTTLSNLYCFAFPASEAPATQEATEEFLNSCLGGFYINGREMIIVTGGMNILPCSDTDYVYIELGG